MRVAYGGHQRRIPLALWSVGLIVAAGLGSLFATYWDDAWHTDIGRDDALIPPHLALYGSVAVAGLAVAAWGSLVVWRSRSLLAMLRHPALLTAAAGGLVTLGSGVADAFWHEAFGRDAVLWSPPHMLAVFGTVALIVGVLAGASPGTPSWLLSAAGGLLLGSTLIAVLEFETDVPQFSETLYLPVLLVSALFALGMLRRLLPGRFAVTRVVGIYVLARLIVAVVLTALGRTAPDLPLAIVGLALADLPWRRPVTAYAAGAAGVSATTLVSGTIGTAGVPVMSVLPTAIPVIAVFVAALLADFRLRPIAALLFAGGIAALPMSSPDPALAHDPGQGEPVAQVLLAGASDGNGTLTLAAELPVACSTSDPCRVLARRAGEVISGTLSVEGRQVTGTVQVPPTSLWFVYFEAAHARGPVETWLALDASTAQRISERRDLYLPAGRDEGAALPVAEIAAGVVLYGLGLAVLGLAVHQTRRSQQPETRIATSM
ncbi:hypothetical protein OHA25_41215 [Nonomuraea sp. NBC_00507]|uniref:hypothetical protein n=1 Tax=Nonomuraea sp. NBC_00507 TaxID=2976002 RepID=UPI002E186EFB